MPYRIRCYKLLVTTVFRYAQNFELSRIICLFLWNFYVSVEFSGFCNGRWKRVKYSIIWSGLGGRGKLISTCRHDCAIKYMTVSRVLTWGILKILNLSQILPVNLVDRKKQNLRVVVTYIDQKFTFRCILKIKMYTCFVRHLIVSNDNCWQSNTVNSLCWW